VNIATGSASNVSAAIPFRTLRGIVFVPGTTRMYLRYIGSRALA